MLFGGDGNDTVTGRQGNDVALLGAGNDRFIWNPGDGSDVVEGQAGSDILDFNGSNVSENISISANGQRVLLLRDVGAVTMDLNGIETINVAAAGGADTITVGDLSGTGVTRVNIDLAVNGAGDGQADTVLVNGTSGDHHVTVSSNAGNLTVHGLAEDVVIQHVEAGNDQLILNSLDGNDTIDASHVAAGQVNLTINGGAGNDTLIGSAGDDTIIGGRGNDVALMGAGNDTFVWNPGDASDTVEGQAGTDTLLFNGSNANENITISANGTRALLTRDVGAVTMDLHGVETIDVNAVGGADTIVVNDVSGTDVKQVNIDLAAIPGSTVGDNQADTVVINGTNGNDVISLSIQNGALVVDGLASRVVVQHFELNDTIHIAGLGGDDVIDASGLGTNGPKVILDGGDGNDVLVGSHGNETMNGGAGDDVLIGNGGIDILDGGPGDNIVIAALHVGGRCRLPGPWQLCRTGTSGPLGRLTTPPPLGPDQPRGDDHHRPAATFEMIAAHAWLFTPIFKECFKVSPRMRRADAPAVRPQPLRCTRTFPPNRRLTCF